MNWDCHACDNEHPGSFNYCPVDGSPRPDDFDEVLNIMREFAKRKGDEHMVIDPSDCRAILDRIDRAGNKNSPKGGGT